MTTRYIRLVYGIGGLVREDAGGQTGQQLFHIHLLAGLQYVVIHFHLEHKEVTMLSPPLFCCHLRPHSELSTFSHIF